MARVKFLAPNRHSRTGHHVMKTENGPVERHRTVTVASGTVIDRRRVLRAVEPRSWQAEVWGHYDNIGELHFAARWQASAVSRCLLYAGLAGEDGAEPTPLSEDSASDPDDIPQADQDANAALAEAILASLHHGQLGQSEMLRRMALHLCLIGETYLVGIDDPDAATGTDIQGFTPRRWYVVSTDELTINRQGKSKLTLPDTGATLNITEDDSLIIRIWNPHPRNGFEPDSSIRAVLPVLREVQGLSDHIAASVDSRLAGAGILAIPNSASLPAPGSSDSGATAPMHADPFINALMVNMITPIRDRDDASAVVPMVIKVPDEAVDSIKHITLSTPLSDNVAELREAALDRFAAGADLPREIVTGTGSANHWSAWQLEEASVKLHIEPLVGVLCDALTQQYLWPMMRAAGVEDPTDYVIWYNSAELTQRPNKSVEAQSLWDKGVLSTEALLRENGFAPADLPAAPEHLRWLAERIALANPALIPELAPILESLSGDDPALPPITAVDATPSSAAPPLDSPSTDSSRPAGPPAATTGITAALSRPRPDHAWWLRTIEQVVLRALELAGKRMLGWARRSQRHWQNASRQVLPWDMYTVLSHLVLDAEDPDLSASLDSLLDGAFDSALVNFGSDECVRVTVDAYCRHLITTGQPHRREYLATWLATRECQPTLQE